MVLETKDVALCGSPTHQRAQTPHPDPGNALAFAFFKNTRQCKRTPGCLCRQRRLPGFDLSSTAATVAFPPPPPHAAAGVVAVLGVAASVRAGIRLLCFHLWTFLLLALLVAV